MTINYKSNANNVVETAGVSVGGKTAQTATVDDATNGGVPQSKQPATSSTMDNDTQYVGHPDEGLFLGRWVLVDSQVSTSLLRWMSSYITNTRQVNEKTGKVEYYSITKWRIRLCYCFCISGSNTSISIYTSNDTFTMRNKKTTIVDGDVEYGRREGDKFITVGKKGTNEVKWGGDKCYMKIVDARYSLVSTLEYDRVEPTGAG